MEEIKNNDNPVGELYNEILSDAKEEDRKSVV